MVDLQAIAEAVEAGEKDQVAALVREVIGAGASPRQVLEEGLIWGMDLISERWRQGEIFIPEVLRSARAVNLGMDILRPMLAASHEVAPGTVLIGTVKGDLHDIGKNIVAMMLSGNGFKVVDLGVDVPPERFVTAVKDEKPAILGMSALLTTTMPMMRITIEAIEKAGLRNGLKIVVGGAPVTREFSEKIGADNYAPDALAAVSVARAMVDEAK